MLEPAMWIPNYGPPDKQDVLPIMVPNPGYGANDYALAREMAQHRTYTETSLGESSTVRKTLGQVRTETMKGTLKLRLDLGDVAYDMNTDLLKKMWAMTVAYKIDPAGIVSVEPTGRLLGNREYTVQEVSKPVIDVGTRMLSAGQLTMQELQEVEARFQAMFTGGRVPSARRQDLTLSLTGTTIIADKISELDTELRLMPTLMNLVEGARIDTIFNYWGRSILRKAGFKDIEKRWPQDPGTVINNPTLRAGLMQGMNQLLQRSSITF